MKKQLEDTKEVESINNRVREISVLSHLFDWRRTG